MTSLGVIEPGYRSTVQDAGRAGHLRDGVPTAGPADAVAFEAAQRLVGNSARDAAIEVVGLPFRFTLDAPRLVAVTGRDVSLRARGTVPGWTAAFVRAADEVVVAGTDRTRFAYLAVSGGIDLAPVLGSRSTYLPAALGPLPRPLAAGDSLPLGAARAGAERAGRSLMRSDGRGILAVRGPHADRFADPDAFFRGAFRVTERSDRMGVRLEGLGLEGLEAAAGEVLSLGVLAGAVQVPHGGDPIVLLADGQTTGGYPVIASVIWADIGRVAQAVPGEEISFVEVDREAARAAVGAVRRWLDAI